MNANMGVSTSKWRGGIFPETTAEQTIRTMQDSMSQNQLFVLRLLNHPGNVWLFYLPSQQCGQQLPTQQNSWSYTIQQNPQREG